MRATQAKRVEDVSSLAESAYRLIEEMIVLRELPPGSMISESRLAEEVGCGRTPVREALLRLKHEGFIEVFPSRGAMVAPRGDACTSRCERGGDRRLQRSRAHAW